MISEETQSKLVATHIANATPEAEERKGSVVLFVAVVIFFVLLIGGGS